jgi:16S rRNA processing protein RimM
MDLSKTGFLAVGVITRPHGIRGEVRVAMYSGGPRQLTDVGRVHLGGENGKVFEIEYVRGNEEAVLLKFQAVEDRNGAELLRGLEIVVPREGWELDKNDFLIGDLVGFDVVGKTGSPIGKVSGAVRGGAHDYLLVDTAGEKGALVPFIKQFVLEIDSKAGRIVVELPEGLI